MSFIKLIATDVDGTLLNEEKEITKATYEAIEKAQAAGCELVIATGRALGEMDELQELLPFVRYFICSNGGFVLDKQTGETLYRECLDASVGIQLLKELHDLGDIYVEAYVAHQVFAPEPMKSRLKEFTYENLVPLIEGSRTFIPNFMEHMEAQSPAMEKIQAFYGSEENKRSILEKYKDRKDLQIMVSVEGNIEFLPLHSNKGNALSALTQRLGIEASQTVAIGDGNNDAPMLRYAGLSYAMGQAAPAVHEAATHSTASNEEEGWAKAILEALTKE